MYNIYTYVIMYTLICALPYVRRRKVTETNYSIVTTYAISYLAELEYMYYSIFEGGRGGGIYVYVYCIDLLP